MIVDFRFRKDGPAARPGRAFSKFPLRPSKPLLSCLNGISSPVTSLPPQSPRTKNGARNPIQDPLKNEFALRPLNPPHPPRPSPGTRHHSVRISASSTPPRNMNLQISDRHTPRHKKARKINRLQQHPISQPSPDIKRRSAANSTVRKTL